MAISSPTPPPTLPHSWTRWLGANERETRAFVDGLAQRLRLTPEQRPLWDRFVEKLRRSGSAAALPDPGEGWDHGQSAALDNLLRLEIAAGRFLGAIEEARDDFGRVYAILSPVQRSLVDAAISKR